MIEYIDEKLIKEDIIKVIDNIYVGNYSSLNYIEYFNISRIIEIKTNHKYERIRYEKNKDIISISIKISENDKIINNYDKIWDFLEYNYNKNILIFCNNGSISIIYLMSYLIAYKYYTYEHAIELIVRNNIDIHKLNRRYMEELLQLDKELHNFKHLIKI